MSQNIFQEMGVLRWRKQIRKVGSSMLYLCLGIKPLQGTSKKTGKPFDSYILHLSHEVPSDPDLFGYEVKQAFVDKKFLLDYVQQTGSYKSIVNQTVNLEYDQGGYVVACSVVPAKK